MNTAPIQWLMSAISFLTHHYTAQIKKQSHIALWMQKYQSTLYRKVLLTFVQLLRYSMLHTNTRNIYITQCVCMYALPSHRQLRPKYSTRTFYGLLPPFKWQLWAWVQLVDRRNRTVRAQSLMGEVWRCRCGWVGGEGRRWSTSAHWR